MGRTGSERGGVLLLTLLITAVLTAIITEVIYTVHYGAAYALSFRDSRQALVLMEGGVDLASSRIRTMIKEKSYTTSELVREVKGLATPAGTLDLRVEDESGRFPVNMILYPNGEVNEPYYSAYKRLLNILGLEVSLAEPLADWIDADDDPRPSGAEYAGYYKALNPPIMPKGGPVDPVDELALVKDHTPRIVKRLMPFATPYGSGRININTAPKEVIMSLADGITGTMADRIIERRSAEPFKDTAEIRKIPGMETIGFSVQGLVTVKSDTFRVFSKGRYGETVREAEAVISPLDNRVLYWRER